MTYPSESPDWPYPLPLPAPPWPNGCAVALLGVVQRRISDGRASPADLALVEAARALLWRDGATPAWHRHADAVGALLRPAGVVQLRLWEEAA